MLQIDHVYEFLYQEIFKDFEVWYLFNGVPKLGDINIHDISVFTHKPNANKKIFFYDQEPFIPHMVNNYMDMFTWYNKLSIDEVKHMVKTNSLPYKLTVETELEKKYILDSIEEVINNRIQILVTSEYSKDVDQCTNIYEIQKLYYFFHGFATLDWYRGYYSLNYNKSLVKHYDYDFISFNRIINNDRSYRIYFISLLKEQNLLEKGLVSFNVTDTLFDDWRDETANPDSKLSNKAKLHAEHHLVNIDKLIIDRAELPGSASADILRDNDAFWHVVTETVFYYDKLQLTEKIFKPIVSKQPFMLLAAPGNLEYLRSYGFRTFDSIIDETYDTIQDNDARIEAVVRQLRWYCSLSEQEKINVMRAIEPIVLHNFHHFYGEFKHIITQELLTNTKTLFQDIGYDDSHINYNNIYHVLTH